MRNTDATGIVKVKEGVAAENLHPCSTTRGPSVYGLRPARVRFRAHLA